jgi:hypothetical protein
MAVKSQFKLAGFEPSGWDIIRTLPAFCDRLVSF